MTHGYIPGDRAGNLAVVIHLVSAVIINLARAIQLIPQIRDRAPSFHRCNGRLYIVTAFMISIAGLCLMSVRGSSGDLSQHLGTTLMAALIMLCAAMALRYALARDGNKAQAIAKYQKSLQLNPKNRNAILVLQKLNGP